MMPRHGSAVGAGGEGAGRGGVVGFAMGGKYFGERIGVLASWQVGAWNVGERCVGSGVRPATTAVSSPECTHKRTDR